MGLPPVIADTAGPLRKPTSRKAEVSICTCFIIDAGGGHDAAEAIVPVHATVAAAAQPAKQGPTSLMLSSPQVSSWAYEDFAPRDHQRRPRPGCNGLGKWERPKWQSRLGLDEVEAGSVQRGHPISRKLRTPDTDLIPEQVQPLEKNPASQHRKEEAPTQQPQGPGNPKRIHTNREASSKPRSH